MEASLQQIASRYTSEAVRVVVLPTMLIQIGEDGYQIEGSTHSSCNSTPPDGSTTSPAWPARGDQPDRRDQGGQRRAKPAAQIRSLSTIIGYAVTTVGAGPVINPTWAVAGIPATGAGQGAVVQIRPSRRSHLSCRPSLL